uniref:ATP-dependent RNA helicase n=1 Tax=Strongyloides papillosus TaxID=174720 RepID=A0A0N5BBD3_STREA
MDTLTTHQSESEERSPDNLLSIINSIRDTKIGNNNPDVNNGQNIYIFENKSVKSTPSVEKEIYVPRRHEDQKIAEERSNFIKENFSRLCDVPSSQIWTTFKFDKKRQLPDSWKSCGLNNELHENLVTAGYEVPREIQKYVVPLMMKGINLEVSARTGCGKTISYLIPVIQGIIDLKSQRQQKIPPLHPIAIIILPTFELSLQVSNNIFKLSKNTLVSCSRVLGGYTKFINVQELQKGCDIVVATIGRLHDMLTDGRLSLYELKYLIIDECDYFLHNEVSNLLYQTVDFIKENTKIMDITVSVFMSSSSPRIKEFLRHYFGDNFQEIKESKSISYGNMNFISNPNIIYKMYFVKERSHKPNKLLEIINDIREYDLSIDPKACTRIIIFTDKIHWSKQITTFLRMDMESVYCNVFNSDLMPREREKYLGEFQMRMADIQILVSTDVLSRGIDIYSLNHIINYDLPECFEFFYHRCGRVGRINNGMAHTIIDENDPYDCSKVHHLMNLLVSTNQLDNTIQTKFYEMYKKYYSKYK